MPLLKVLGSIENLHYAWRKTKRLLRQADGYVDNGEVVAFELNLEAELASIGTDLRSGNYRLKPLRPLPRPKKKDSTETALDRQYFHVAIRDQVAWIAMANILGPRLDRQMPAWSYGNRIYRAAWYEEKEGTGHKQLEIGPYRHASGNLYRKFQHSWPLFRRHIVRTARIMANPSASQIGDEQDEAEDFAYQAGLRAKLEYFDQNYWRNLKRPQGSDLFYASLDLKQFFPNIGQKAILKAISSFLESDDRAELVNLVAQMLEFEIDYTGTPPHLLNSVEPPFDTFGNKIGIPTGLFASGFLANVAMLPIDLEVQRVLRTRRNIAHFRYVDDHTILALDFDSLCDWIESYGEIIRASEIGVTINEKKYDPASLVEFLEQKKSALPAGELNSTGEESEFYKAARRDSRVDGANPTKLLTKTLAQVSAIAAGNANILDDDELRERLRVLEWLLLADIPARELKPETRASFAAGQISLHVPILIQEADGLVDIARAFAQSRLDLDRRSKMTPADKGLKEARAKHQREKISLNSKIKAHLKQELASIEHYFKLQMQAFNEFPGKPRLFYRLCEYCLVTGHPGLRSIGVWINDQRHVNNANWADYYAGLSLQIFAVSLLKAARILSNPDALHSQSLAAERHIEDLSQINLRVFLVPTSRSAWFHRTGAKEFAVALMSAAEVVADLGKVRLAQKLKRTAGRIDSKTSPNLSQGDLYIDNHRSPGIWAEFTEQILNPNSDASSSWLKFFLPKFFSGQIFDVLAMRRFPERLTDDFWRTLNDPGFSIPRDDAGWWRDSLSQNLQRIPEALASPHPAIRNAALSLQNSMPAQSDDMTLGASIDAFEWITYLRTACSPFDPRRSEWTALEILRAILETEGDLELGTDGLKNIHPANVRIPRNWMTTKPDSVSWEEWRTQAKQNGAFLKMGSTAIEDYRFSLSDPELPWASDLVSIGRLLLGLIHLSFDGPRIWNVRGNERTVSFERGTHYQSLAISSLTLRILEGCLSSRSAENLEFRDRFGLFGLDSAETPSDMTFDPPQLVDFQKVTEEIQRSQDVLKLNQIAVSYNQPRQLIPFGLADFARGDISIEDGAIDVE